MRAVLGFVAAAIFPAIVLAVTSPITEGRLVGALGILPLLLVFSCGAVLLLGLPLFLLLRRFRLVRWWSAIASGLVIGALVAVITRAPGVVKPGDFIVMVPLGGATAFLFWLIWRPRRVA